MSKRATFPKGTLFGSYTLGEHLGGGGQGDVYEAHHVRLNKRVAVKTLSKERSADPEAIERFVREGRAASAIRHDHVVEIFDVDTTDGVAFMAMEYLEGETLSGRISRGPIAPSELIALLLPVLDAIDAAHRKQIAHRDLKPDNIFLARTQRGDVRPVVLDFGISKILDEDPEKQLTQTTAQVGTPYYMAPEQLRGARYVTARSDQYALGVILYEGLCGANPYAPCDNLPQLVWKIQSAELAAPSTRVSLPPGLEAVVLRAMHVDPAQRFADVRELSAALLPFAPAALAQVSGVVNNDSLSATVPSFNPPPVQTTGRSTDEVHNAVTAGPIDPKISTTLSGAAGELPIQSFELRRSQGARRWVLPLVLVSIGGVAWLGVNTMRDAKAPAAAIAGEKRSTIIALEQPTVGLQALERYRAGKNHLTSAASWIAASEDFAQKSAQRDAPQRWRAATLFCEAVAELHGSKVEPGIIALTKASELDPGWALPHAALANAYTLRDDLKRGLEHARKAQQLEPSWPWAIAVGARLLSHGDQMEEAITEMRRAIELAPRDPELLSLAALLYHHEHNDSEAHRYATDALQIDPDSVAALVLSAELALETHNPAAALVHASRAVAVAPTDVSGRLVRADALRMDGKSQVALMEYRKVIELADRYPNHGAPQERIEAIRASLAADTLPTAPYFDPNAGTAPTKKPRERQRMPARSQPPRSRPSVPMSPPEEDLMRSRPAPMDEF